MMSLLNSIGKTDIHHWCTALELKPDMDRPLHFLRREWARFPSQIRWGLIGVSALFQIQCLWRFGRPFQWLELNCQTKMLDHLRHSSSSTGELIRLYDSLILMSLLEGRADD